MSSPYLRRAIRLAICVPATAAAVALIGALPLAGAVPSARGSASATADAPASGHLVSRSIDLSRRTATVRTSGRATAAGSLATVDVPSMTQSVSLTWSGAPDGAARIRSHSGRGWSAWASEGADRDEGPDRGGNGRAGIGPFWLGHDGVDQVQVAVVRGPLNGLSLDAMRWAVSSGRAAPATNAVPGRPVIHPPSEWGSGGWQSSRSGCSSAPTVMPSLRSP